MEWLIIVVQFAVIAWLAYGRIKPAPRHEPVNVAMIKGPPLSGWLTFDCSCGEYSGKAASHDWMHFNMNKHRDSIHV